jgi:hypothetical protein
MSFTMYVAYTTQPLEKEAYALLGGHEARETAGAVGGKHAKQYRPILKRTTSREPLGHVSRE